MTRCGQQVLTLPLIPSVSKQVHSPLGFSIPDKWAAGSAPALLLPGRAGGAAVLGDLNTLPVAWCQDFPVYEGETVLPLFPGQMGILDGS